MNLRVAGAGLFLIGSFCVPVTGQKVEVAKHVYDASQDSVFLIYLNGKDGLPEALGSAFLVAPKTLITNAHVVKDGTPVLAVGPVRIPVRVVTRDLANDLAVLSVDVDLTSKSLALATVLPTPGERIFAIGNPEGFEKTISEGLISGVRKLAGRSLLQITSPISHGSSGGPILNSDGEVVGVAVGMITDGQNLNFAVPVTFVREILTRKPETSLSEPSLGLPELQALAVKIQNEGYASEEASGYQQDIRFFTSSVRVALARSEDPNSLQALACLGSNQFSVLEEGVESARKLYRLQHTRENAALLAYLLLQQAEFDDLFARVSKEGSVEKTKALAERSSRLAELLKLTGINTGEAKGATPPLSIYATARAKTLNEEYANALLLNQSVLPRLSRTCGTDLREKVLRDLIVETDKLKRPVETEKWFQRFALEYHPSAWDWDSEGDRRDLVGDHANAARSYDNAAIGDDNLAIDYCWAVTQHYLNRPTGADSVLTSGRKCLDASIKNTNNYRTKQFTERLPIVYRLMATILEDRGVHQPALEYIKEALKVKPEDPISLNEEAKIFESMDRYAECISAAQAAITASDGKFRWMHFTLGGCYFDVQNWSQAAASYRIAAENDKGDPAPAFNLALSYQRQHFDSDAKVWFTEALKRNPDSELREKILTAMKR